MTNTINKNTFVTLAGVRALLAIFLMALFVGVAHSETAPRKTEAAPKKAPAAAKPAQPAPAKAPGTTPVPPFDHAKTGFLLRDVHTTLRCEQCHVDGVFKNTPKDCAGCHSIGSRVAATPRPVNHVQTTQPCDTCHTSPTTFLVASFKHIGVTSNCSTCHNGQSLGVVSKPVNHFPTLMPCENCHNTTTFSTARMDHTGITTGCSNCHLGQFAGVVSKPAAHIVTTGDCGVCHNTTTFLGATYDHSTVTAGTCGTCHLGQQSGVVAKPAVHIPTLSTGNACDACHTAANTSGYTSFLGAMYHQSTTAPSPVGICSTCHTGQYSGVQGQPSFHIPTSGAQCDTCHTQSNTANYTTFYGATFSHATVAAGSCGTCHNGVTALGKPATHVATTAACDTCHTNTQNYTTWLGAIYTHNPTPPTPGSCPACHNGITALGKPANHLATTLSCDACHTQANTANFTTFLGATTVDHSTIAAGTCATCHNGSQATGKTAGHIPTGSLSCDNCHQKYNGTTVLTFLPGTMNHTAVTGIGCSICHSGAYTTQGLQYGGAQAKPSNHIPTTITTGLECTTCHISPIYTSSTGWLSEQMNHNNAQGMGSPIYCVTCHLSGNTYLGTMKKFSHNGASTAKDCSSSSCHKPLGRTGTVYQSWN